MKKVVICLCGLVLFTGCQAPLKQDKAMRKLSSPLIKQDHSTIVVDESPLTGMKIFAIIPFYADVNQKIHQQIETVTKKELNSIGIIVPGEENGKINMVGMGWGNVLTLRVEPLSTWEGRELPITKVSLHLTTAITVNASQKQAHLTVWQAESLINTDLKGSQDYFEQAVENLWKQFVTSYSAANKEKEDKPQFYLY